ncbi:hypothetical protein HOLleu_30532 [Holothuria leucospilota]|uniref:Uncharacterized protein n=1 Tax=Holothuria leucospilota TaxID=206669 RepID=A0A9Q1BKM2_HOLLE|nr:hypothetical protein HOLleu_30532 [Holothuria leucospilota]
MSSANSVDGRLQEKQYPPASFVPVSDQGLQTSPLPAHFEVTQSQSTGCYPYTTHSPVINHGYVAEQHPPAYNELYNQVNLGYNPGTQVNQPHPGTIPCKQITKAT